MLTEQFTTPDQATLRRTLWDIDAPRCIVVIAHGMAEHAARYDAFAQVLNAQGIAVWSHDHRGHGGSVQGGLRGHFADTQGWTRVVEDLIQLVEAARAKHPGVPVVLFGHSMGSFVARAAVLARPGLIDGLILSATGFRQTPLAKIMARIAAWDGRKHGMQTPSRLMAKLVFGTFNLRFRPRRTPFDWLSRDTAEVDKYIADPDCGFDCSPQLWQDLFRGIVDMEWREAGAGIVPTHLSVLMIAGSHDPVSMGGRGCRQLQERYLKQGLRDIVVTIYPEGRHELLNETNRQEVFDGLLMWLNRRFT